MSLYGLLQGRGLSLPGATTILENVNLVSPATRELIFDKQMALILGEANRVLEYAHAPVLHDGTAMARNGYPHAVKTANAAVTRFMI